MSSLTDKVVLILKGFCMGIADVVPGVSGGTMALILGIYRELIDAIKSFDSNWLRALGKFQVKEACSIPHFGFLLPLILGIFLALVFFTRVIPLPELIINYPEEVYSLFFGLILGSILVLLFESGKVQASGMVMLVTGLVLGYLVFTMIPANTPETSWFVFLSGALAICAMILPGISGSFILLLLNKYSYIFSAIGYFKMAILVPFALGAATGLIVASRVLSWLLHTYYRNTILFITGLLIASLYVLWPYQERVYEVIGSGPKLINSKPVLPPVINTEILLHFLLLAIGFIVVMGLHRVKQNRINS